MASDADSSKYTVQVITKYMCRYCARQFDSSTEMQNHISSHVRGKAPHSCYVCDKTYRTPSKLQRHVRVHSGERPYACNLCGRRFTRSDHVKQHMKVHMPQKQKNMCRLCGMKFLRRQTLHIHLQNNHSIGQVYTCHRCGEAFESLQQLHYHKESHASFMVTEQGTSSDGMLIDIKQEPGDAYGDEETNVKGLAKFSLGPQPLVNEDSNDGGPGFSLVKNRIDMMDMDVKEIPMRRSDMNGTAENDMEGVNDTNGEAGGNADICYDVEQAAKMAISACFSLADSASAEGTNMNQEEFDNLKTSTVADRDGMKMYVLPSEPKSAEDNAEKEKETDPDCDENKNEPESSKKDVNTPNDVETEKGVLACHKPSPKSTSPEKGSVVNTSPGSDVSDEIEHTESITRYMLTKPLTKVSDMIRSRVRQRFTPLKVNNISYRLAPDSSLASTTSIVSTSDQSMSMHGKKMNRCEHCCIWFEDYAMSLLHNSLHSADDADPFTCRKCMKKMGNRLEFMAHLIWHLEPTMDG